VSGINSRLWNRTMMNLCGIVVAILKMATGRNCSMLGINSGHHYLPTYQILMISDNVEKFAVLWWPFWKWRPVEIFQCRDIIIYPNIKFWWYRTMLNFYRPFFIPYFGSHFENGRHLEILKMQNCSSNGDLSLCQILCLYHYTFRSYRNFIFAIGFYSNPHPLWTPQNMTLTPFTTKLKTFGPTRNIYL
jgi:hypothetical protein